MVNEKIADELQDRIGETPEHIQMVANKGKAGVRNAKIAVALKNMKSGTSIIYTEKEFYTIFGKNGKTSLINSLKKNGIKKPAIHISNEKVYVFNRSEV